MPRSLEDATGDCSLDPLELKGILFTYGAMLERAGILHSWAYIRQAQLGGQGSSEMVRHLSEQSSTFRSVTY